MEFSFKLFIIDFSGFNYVVFGGYIYGIDLSRVEVLEIELILIYNL